MARNSLDLSRLELIKQAPAERIVDPRYLEDLVKRLGLNNEIMHEQPGFARELVGGLKMWQYPNQFGKYLSVLGRLGASSYVEIGCRWGGTFACTMEFLRKTSGDVRGLAVDVIDSPVKHYCALEKHSRFIRADSLSAEFLGYIGDQTFDIAFIDGNHDYQAVMRDYENFVGRSQVLVFHDTVSDACPGVVRAWGEIKQHTSGEWHSLDITDQYDDVFRRTGRRYLGLGMLLRKSFLEARGLAHPSNDWLGSKS